MSNLTNDAAVLKKQNEENERLKELKIRTKNCCCRYCGGELKLRRILYGSVKEGRIEIFCSECDRIEYGVNKEIYHVAKYFEDEFQLNLYPANDDTIRTYQMNVAKLCDIMAWGCKNLGLLEYDGFKVPVDISKSILGEEIILYDKDLNIDDVEIADMDEDAMFGRKTGGDAWM
ncbi:MAG: hypothetical protein J6A39_09955 [Peptococcaceae bacterium]|nr:hypothetical protein [Peptococcaceae bacterium]